MDSVSDRGDLPRKTKKTMTIDWPIKSSLAKEKTIRLILLPTHVSCMNYFTGPLSICIRPEMGRVRVGIFGCPRASHTAREHLSAINYYLHRGGRG